MSRVIEVIVSPQGDTTIQTKGFSGTDCLEASKFLEQSLGIPMSDRKTPEFFQTASSEQHVNQQ